MREVVLVKTGQVRRWREPQSECGTIFLVLDPYSIPPPGSDWVDHGWWVLQAGNREWVYEGDIEDDSDVIDDTYSQETQQ